MIVFVSTVVLRVACVFISLMNINTHWKFYLKINISRLHVIFKQRKRENNEIIFCWSFDFDWERETFTQTNAVNIQRKGKKMTNLMKWANVAWPGKSPGELFVDLSTSVMYVTCAWMIETLIVLHVGYLAFFLELWSFFRTFVLKFLGKNQSTSF